MAKIAVTGGSGGAGRFVVANLIEHGHTVTNLDRVKPAADVAPWVEIDVTDYGAMVAAIHGHDAIVHLAANPEPDFDTTTGAARFHVNTLAAYNAFQAAVALGITKVVWASSETTLGFPFATNRPASIPVDETHTPQPQNSYALSKLVTEDLAGHMSRLYGIAFVGLRFSNILFEDPDHPASYAHVPGYWDDPQARRFNLWSYIDARDAAEAVRRGLESDLGGSENFIIAAADTIMKTSNRALIDAVFPGVEIDPDLGENETMISIAKARRLLGFEPAWSWRRVLGS